MGKRRFTLTGLCVPQSDYMVDISDRVEKVKEMVDAGLYFTINRPRQYGKTTLLAALARRISGDCICASISFEGVGDESFESAAAFCGTLMRQIQKALKRSNAGYEAAYADSWNDPGVTGFEQLSEHITKMCRGQKVILLIDEVDRTSNNRIFIHFIGLLRDKFLLRKNGMDETFQSVILAGVYDVRNLKVKLINEGIYTPSQQEGHVLNSPWNIAAPFLVDMSFHPDDIAGMLKEYEAEHLTGMDIDQVAGAIYEYTGGYPFLVSQICQMLDEDGALSKDWSPHGVRSAVKMMMFQEPLTTLFDDVSKNLENHQDIHDLIYKILILGERMEYTLSNSAIQRAKMFGFIKNKDGSTVISNRIFEIYITGYFTLKDSLDINRRAIKGYQGDLIAEGRFDMALCLTKFAEGFRELFTENEAKFVEEHGRMLFLTYLKPLINGKGFCHIESQLTDQRRMDLVVDYGTEQFIIEMKMWYGEAAHEKAYSQLTGYLRGRGATAGYLLTYDFRKAKNREPRAQWVEWEGLRIFDVIL